MDFIRISEVKQVDFGRNQQTANKINDFVSDATKGLIKDLIKPSSIDGLTRMALVNAIYFKGDWELEFPEEDTAPTPFKIRPGRTISYPYGMNIQSDFDVANVQMSGGNAKVVSLPFKDEDFAMYLILPPKGMFLQKSLVIMIFTISFHHCCKT